MNDEESGSRSRLVTWQDPQALAARLRGMSGLEAMRAVAAGELPTAPIADLLGFELISAEEGGVVFGAVPAEYHYNPIGIVHGGLTATLIDSATGCAVHTTLPAGLGYTSLDLKSTGKLIAHGTATFLILRPAAADT